MFQNQETAAVNVSKRDVHSADFHELEHLGLDALFRCASKHSGDAPAAARPSFPAMRLDHQLKQQLAREFCAIVEGWTVTQVATRAGIYPSRVSELRSGKIAGYSISRLITMIAKFGYDIEIAIRPTKLPIIIRQGPTTLVQRYDRLDQPLPRASDPGAGSRDSRLVPGPARP